MLRVGAVAVAVLVVALPAAGDTPSTKAGSQQARSTASTVPPYVGDDYQDQTIETQQTSAEARKAKVHFVFPDVYLRAFVISCFSNADQDGYNGGDTANKECSDVVPLPLPPEYRDPANLPTVKVGTADAFLVTKRGGRTGANTYGSFPPIKVRALVFGSIPVSATLRLEQTVTNGYVDPIKAKYAAITDLYNTGALVYPGLPRVPPLRPEGYPWDLTVRNQIDATLRLRLSDVAVDGRPVEVGANCGTVSPVLLTVREPLGYSVGAGYQPPKVRGLPGGFLPLEAQEGQHPGYFDGNANVPAFANCGSPTEDLDPLLTALISSPKNRVSAYLPTGALSDYYCSSAIADSTCTRAVAAAQRRTRAVALAIAANKSPAEIRKLQAKLQLSDYVIPKIKPNGDR